METISLIELMNKYSINIPIIQRDYAQGREGEHPQLVRKKLLCDIKNAVDKENEPLDIGFIYGRSSEEEKVKKFYPADGQQRLTTLYLIHLVAFYDDEDKDILLGSGFKYDARPTTRDFFKKLAKERKTIFEELQNGDQGGVDPEKIIRDEPWYFGSWNYDPSVKSALKVLNDIWKLWHEKEERERLKERLLDSVDPPIYFHFLPLDDIGREDDLYIKLNARGLPLTAFENFKSAFLARTEECSDDRLYDEISRKFDNAWSDFIWNIVKTDYDRAYISLFEIVLQNCGILESEVNKELSKEWHYDLDYQKIDKGIIESVRNFLNYLVDDESSTTVVDIVKTILKKESPSYYDRVMIHCVYEYLSDEPDITQIDNDRFEEWVRIIYNLAGNTTIDEVSLYKAAIEGINSLFGNKNSLLTDLAGNKLASVKGFNKEQFDEECQKARIMEINPTKRNNILNAEKRLRYFGGQIRCALKFSDYEKSQNDTEFNACVEILDKLFSENGPRNGKLLRRALLSVGDYLYQVGNNSSIKTFCVDNPNEYSSTRSLKWLFSECEDEVRSVIDDVIKNHTSSGDIDTELNNIINSNISHIPQNDWRYCMILYSDLFDSMSNSYLKAAFPDCDYIDEPLLIGQKNLNSNNCSVYLKVLLFTYGKDNIAQDESVQKGLKFYRYLKIGDKYITFSGSQYHVYDNFEKVGSANTIWENSGTRTDLITEVMEYLK